MQTISTKCLAATNHLPARIVAVSEGGHRRTMSRHAFGRVNAEEAHLSAALALARSLQWTGELIGGATADGFCFVFADSHIRGKI